MNIDEIIKVNYDANCVEVLRQDLLPQSQVYFLIQSVDDCAKAIKEMYVRGAPLISITALAYIDLFCYQWVNNFKAAVENRHHETADFIVEIQNVMNTLLNIRMTAYNKQKDFADLTSLLNPSESPESLYNAIHGFIVLKIKGYKESSLRIGLNLFTSLSYSIPSYPTTSKPLYFYTHCNAGALAMPEFGTALAPIYKFKEAGYNVTVIVNETRPLLQGARLTAYELQRAGISVVIVADSSASMVFRNYPITSVIVGADTVTSLFGVYNKVGTCNLAMVANEFSVPFYVCCPESTIEKRNDHVSIFTDYNRNHIEVRSEEEFDYKNQESFLIDKESRFWNPAFDYTPSKYISGIVTEKGIYHLDKGNTGVWFEYNDELDSKVKSY